MIFRRARQEDFTHIKGIIEQGRKRIGALGIDQWQDGYPNEEVLREDLQTGKGWVVEADGDILLYMSLGFDGEPAYDEIKGDWIDDGSYMVVHRLAVHDKALHRGLARWALLKAEEEAKIRGLASVRIDTHQGNLPMMQLIRSCRYVYCGEVTFGPKNTRVAFQKRQFLGDPEPPSYNTFLFDADGTILDFEDAERQALHHVVEVMGATWTQELGESYNKINKSYWKRFERNEITKEELLLARFYEFVDLWGLPGDPVDWAATYQPRLGQGFKTIPYAREVLEALKGKVDLHLITNGEIETQRSRMRGSGLGKYFEGIYVSEEVGYQKPDIRYFNHIERDLGLETWEGALILGDSLSSDIQGGINSGVDTCWFNPKGHSLDREILPNYVIRDLREIFYFIKA